jgi:hypothetical protein
MGDSSGNPSNAVMYENASGVGWQRALTNSWSSLDGLYRLALESQREVPQKKQCSIPVTHVSRESIQIDTNLL